MLHSYYAFTVCLYHFVLLVERHQGHLSVLYGIFSVSARYSVDQETSELKKVKSRRQTGGATVGDVGTTGRPVWRTYKLGIIFLNC
jgi:hypothetical protein